MTRPARDAKPPPKTKSSVGVLPRRAFNLHCLVTARFVIVMLAVLLFAAFVVGSLRAGTAHGRTPLPGEIHEERKSGTREGTRGRKGRG